MGVCVTKADRESADLLARTLLADPSLTSLQELISLREGNIAQVVTVAANSPNPLKLDARKVMQRLVRLRKKNEVFG